MEDPLTDPRAGELLSAAPDDVGAVASLFRAAANEAHMTSVGLQAARDDGLWRGRAANAFRHSIGRLPVSLNSMGSGFGDVAEALTAYEPQLAELQSSFRRTAAELQQARAGIGRSPTMQQASEIMWLTGRAGDLLNAFATARETCRRAIAAAEQTAPAHPASGSVAIAVGGSGEGVTTAEV